ncbi:MAG: glycosyltransferase family 4 protein [Roseiflexaceae bacterium]
MIRILHVVESTIAGVRRHVYTQVRESDRSRFHIAVACPPQRDLAYGDVGFVHDLEQLGVPVYPLAMRRAIHPAGDFRALARLISLLRLGQYDIIHAHSSKAGFLARLAARVAGGPATIYAPHGLYFLGLRSPLKRRFYLTLEQLAGRLTDRLIAVSEGERAVLLRERIAPADRIVCIENGVLPLALPANYDRQAQRAALGQPSDGPLIGTAARLAAQKNPTLFLEAAARLLQHRPDARFVWCGGGELADQTKAHAEALGIAHAVRLLGHREDVVPILAAFDLFWLTSSYEGLPCVLLEAMALSIPIVATDVVGTCDALQGHAGLLVPPNDAAALADSTLTLLDQPARLEALARAGHQRYRERGQAQRMVAETEQVYHDLVQMRKGRQRNAVTSIYKS